MASNSFIQEQMTIEDVFRKFPSKSQKLAQIMTNSGLHCVGCNASTFETIEQGMLGHGMSQRDIRKLVSELNKVVLENEKEQETEDIKFTDFAAEKCKSFRRDINDGFKVGLNHGSCGWTYDFKFKKERADNEAEFKDKGIRIFVEKESLDKLKGMVIDYVDGLQNAGFKILNPNVKGTCGCGSSVLM